MPTKERKVQDFLQIAEVSRKKLKSHIQYDIFNTAKR